jgi:hypothetical protein
MTEYFFVAHLLKIFASIWPEWSKEIICYRITSLFNKIQREYVSNKKLGKTADFHMFEKVFLSEVSWWLFSAAVVLTLLNGTGDDIRSLPWEATLNNISTINKLPLTETMWPGVGRCQKQQKYVKYAVISCSTFLNKICINWTCQTLDFVHYLGTVTDFSCH